MQIDASAVKALRSQTGAGMMDCKKALQESEGDFEKAVQWLREKGLSRAAKKADRVAAEGLIGIAVRDRRAVVVEVNSETDFVARNEQFQVLVREIAAVALEVGGERAAVLSSSYPGSQISVEERLVEAVATIGENISLRRVACIEVPKGVVAAYIHNAVSEGLGKIGVLVGLESAGDSARLEAFGRQLAMHVAATAPLALSPEELDSSVIETERAVYAAQARDSGKAEAIIEKMLEGRLRKFYEEVTLLKQSFVLNSDVTVAQAVDSVAKELNTPVRLTSFVRFVLGEGIEKKESDFAAEVAALGGGS